MLIELTPEIFNYFCDNILREREKVELTGLNISIISKTLNLMPDSCQQVWHIQITTEGKHFLWRKRDWLIALEHYQKVKEDSQLYNDILFERKEMFRRVCEGLVETLGLGRSAIEDAMVKSLAVKIITNKPEAAAKFLGIDDLDKVRELPQKHFILEEGIEL